jgi:hypothetical protein
MDLEYKVTGELWIYPGEASWFFVSVPNKYYDELKNISSHLRRGFGSIKVLAKIDTVEWYTSIFPDNKSRTYLLPVKKPIRKQCNLRIGSNLKVSIRIVEHG